MSCKGKYDGERSRGKDVERAKGKRVYLGGVEKEDEEYRRHGRSVGVKALKMTIDETVLCLAVSSIESFMSGNGLISLPG